MSYIQGADLLRQRVASYLIAAVPVTLPIARTASGATELQLPVPVRYDAYDPYISTEWPVMGMYVVTDRDNVRRDINDAAEREYWTLYSCRMFVGAITPKNNLGEFVTVQPYEECVRMRDRLTSVLKNVLLASPSLGGFDVEVLEETISTDYEDASPINEKTKNVFLAAAVVNVDIRMTESLYLPALGTVATTNVIAEHVGIGEEL